MAKQINESKTPPGDMLTANLLAMLKGWQACGYEMMNRLSEAGLGDYNSGTIYRNLRQMEKLGLVSSMWDTSAEGPARRVYSLTKAGSLFLENWIRLLESHRSALETFMDLASGAARPRRSARGSEGRDRKNGAHEFEEERQS